MDTIAAYFASHGIVSSLFWICVGLICLWFFARFLFYLIVGIFCFSSIFFSEVLPELIENITYYFKHREIFDRQNEFEEWLKEQFDEAGIGFNCTKRRRFLDYKYLAHRLNEHNLFFSADVPPEKVEAYKRIIGVAFNTFPWLKVSKLQLFSPYRPLDRAWAKEYAVAQYACPLLSSLCGCGCNKARICDFEWKNLGDVAEGEVALTGDYPPPIFNCRDWSDDGLPRNRFVSDGSAYGYELVVELTPTQKASLLAQVRYQRGER